MKLILIRPRGFCAGVIRAIQTVEEALKKFGPPVYVHHEIVHNKHVVGALKKRGVIFVENLKEVPSKSPLIYSAHGVAPNIREEAKHLNLIEIDATCVLVERIHDAVKKYAKEGYKIILAGHKNHAEVIGILGEAPSSITVIESVDEINKLPFNSSDKLFFASQTTLSVYDTEKIKEALIKNFPAIKTLPGSSICYATTNRQTALKYLTTLADLIIIVGDIKSSNSNSLLKTALNRNVKAYLVNDETEIKPEWLKDIKTIGMTAGASTPENIVQLCVNVLCSYGAAEEEKIFKDESISFSLPKALLH
jgi:4-hydroxy-3-methylbut-2-en-1-yl diphosphate reductase